jgi:hypothetical protein
LEKPALPGRTRIQIKASAVSTAFKLTCSHRNDTHALHSGWLQSEQVAIRADRFAVVREPSETNVEEDDIVPDTNPRPSEDSTEQIAESSERAFGQREDFDYDVFISYRSVDGRNMAEWLSKGLRTYRAPSSFPQTIPRIRIYRDTELERVTPAIWQEQLRPRVIG